MPSIRVKITDSEWYPVYDLEPCESGGVEIPQELFDRFIATKKAFTEANGEIFDIETVHSRRYLGGGFGDA